MRLEYFRAHVMRSLGSASLLIALLIVLLLASGCASLLPTTQRSTTTPRATAATPTATPPPLAPAGLLVFGSVGKRTSDAAGIVLDQYTTTLYDLNPQTGALLWKTAAYAGQALQRPIVLDHRAFFAIGANLRVASTTRSGAVTLYAADLVTGQVTTLTTLPAVGNSSGFSYNFSMIRLDPLTVALSYLDVTSSGAVGVLLAFSTTPATPHWRVQTPANTYPLIIGEVQQTLEVFAYHRDMRSFSLLAVNPGDGRVLRDVTVPLIHTSGSSVFADGVLVLEGSTSFDGSSGWSIGGYSAQDGSVLWAHSLGNASVIYGAADGLVFFLGGTATGEALVALNAADGTQEWTTAIPGYASVDGDGTQVYVTFAGQREEVESLNATTGQAAWSHTWPGSADQQVSVSEVTVDHQRVYCGVTVYDAQHDPTQPSSMYAYATSDGAQVWRQTIPGWLRFPTETNHP